MNEYEKDKNEFGEYIDVKIGREHKENSTQDSKNNNWEEKMLIMVKKQTECLIQIKNIATYFFYLSIISIVIVFIGIFHQKYMQ